MLFAANRDDDERWAKKPKLVQYYQIYKVTSVILQFILVILQMSKKWTIFSFLSYCSLQVVREKLVKFQALIEMS